MQLESKVYCLGVDALAQLAFASGDERVRKVGALKENLFMIRGKIEPDVSEADSKKTLSVGLIASVNGKPPSFEDDTTEATPAKVKVEPTNSTEKATEKTQGTETKVNVEVTKVLRWEFKIHGRT